MRNLQYGSFRFAILHQVVISNTRGDDRLLRISTFLIYIIRTLIGFLRKNGLSSYQFCIVLLCECWKKNKMLHVLWQRHGILLRSFVLCTYNCTAVSHTSCHAKKNRRMQLFTERKSSLRHLISFLLVRGLHRRNHSELTIEAAILLILAGVH